MENGRAGLVGAHVAPVVMVELELVDAAVPILYQLMAVQGVLDPTHRRSFATATAAIVEVGAWLFFTCQHWYISYLIKNSNNVTIGFNDFCKIAQGFFYILISLQSSFVLN